MTTLVSAVDPPGLYTSHRTAVTVLSVTPAREGALVEIDAVAAVPTA